MGCPELSDGECAVAPQNGAAQARRWTTRVFALPVVAMLQRYNIRTPAGRSPAQISMSYWP